MMLRRTLLATLASTLMAGCANPPSGPSAQERQALAPTGRLRVGVYPGSPSSWVKDASGEDRGVSVEVGKLLARRLGVPYEQIEFPRVAVVLDKLKAGQVDFAVTNATPARARDMDFSEPLLALELGYLVPAGSTLTSINEFDRPGIRIGVSEGSTSQATLSLALKQAKVVGAPTLQAAAQMLTSGQVEAFATNKAILFEMSDRLPGARVLDGRWGLEQLAIAIPKGREAAMAFLRNFAEELKATGEVKRAADRAGLRGTLPAAR